MKNNDIDLVVASGSNLTLGTVGSDRSWALHRHFGRTQMRDFDH